MESVSTHGCNNAVFDNKLIHQSFSVHWLKPDPSIKGFGLNNTFKKSMTARSKSRLNQYLKLNQDKTLHQDQKQNGTKELYKSNTFKVYKTILIQLDY